MEAATIFYCGEVYSSELFGTSWEQTNNDEIVDLNHTDSVNLCLTCVWQNLLIRPSLPRVLCSQGPWPRWSSPMNTLSRRRWYRIGSDMCYWIVTKIGTEIAATTVQHFMGDDSLNPLPTVGQGGRRYHSSYKQHEFSAPTEQAPRVYWHWSMGPSLRGLKWTHADSPHVRQGRQADWLVLKSTWRTQQMMDGPRNWQQPQ